MPSAQATLAGHPLFRQMDPDRLRRVDDACLWLRPSAGQWIIDQADDDRSVYIVVTGRVRVVIHSGRGDLTLADIDTGSFFGEMSAIDGGPRSASVVALNASLIARMQGPTFLEAMAAHPPLNQAVLSLLTGRIRLLNRRLSDLTTLDARHRLYAELLRLARHDRVNPSRAVISPPLSQTELAARISAQRETVSREITAMERAGLLERTRSAIVLTNAVALTALIETARDT